MLSPYGIWWLANEADYAALAVPQICGSVLYVGIISTTAGFVLWSKGLTYMDASIGGLFMFFQPLVGTILGWLLLGENMTSYFIPGFVLIAIGVLLAMKGGNTTAAEKLAKSRR
jgi:drug/metabolite transporter (DMT)-like permease